MIMKLIVRGGNQEGRYNNSMKVKDILKLFEGIDPETVVTITSVIECHRSSSICENADIRADVEDGVVVLYVDGEETDFN